MNGAVMARMDATAWAMLLVLSLLWGSSFVFVEVILTELPVFTLVALRVMTAAAALWIVAFAVGAKLPRSPSMWLAFFLMGIFNNAVPFSLIVWGQTSISAGLAAILNATTPLFTALLAGMLLSDERLTTAKVTGICLGVLGVAVMIGPAAILSAGGAVLAQLAVVGAALSYGFSAVYGRRFKGLGVSPLVIAAGQASMSAAILLPIALVVDQPFALPMPSTGVWLSVLANGVLSTALAYILYFAILARSGATNVALVTVLVPVVAVLLGAATLGEAVTLEQLLGMALIALGFAVIDGRMMSALWGARRLPRRG
ncbi:MAG: DMT family transporter [Pseudomonadota bacterium]